MRWLISFFLFTYLSVALAHASIVIVTLTITPNKFEAQQDFQIKLYLEDLLKTPIEDAVILVEATPESSSVQPIIANLKEELAGSYQATLNLPREGKWELFFRDQTFKQEEATATATIDVGKENPEIEFIFPPTKVSSSNLWIWLIWVIGLPIIAGIIVTVLVLSNSASTKS